MPSDQPYQGLSKFTILFLRLLFWWLCIELKIFSKFEAIAIFGNNDQFDLITIMLN
jgi:hypothetical protein